MSKSPILVALEGALGDICVVTGQLSLIIESHRGLTGSALEEYAEALIDAAGKLRALKRNPS